MSVADSDGVEIAYEILGERMPQLVEGADAKTDTPGA
jgi:hypothetical protein